MESYFNSSSCALCSPINACIVFLWWQLLLLFTEEGTCKLKWVKVTLEPNPFNFIHPMSNNWFRAYNKWLLVSFGIFQFILMCCIQSNQCLYSYPLLTINIHWEKSDNSSWIKWMHRLPAPYHHKERHSNWHFVKN